MTSSSRQAGLGRGLGFRHDRGDPLADEAHHIVENVRIVRIDQMILVGGRAVEPARNVLPGEDVDHARHRHGLVAADRNDARMRMGRAQHLEVQQAIDRHIHCVACATGDDRFGEWVRQACAAGMASHVMLGLGDAVNRIADRTVAGTAAQIAFQRMRQVRPSLVIERGSRHDHARCAIAALERLRVEERLLHRMQCAVLRETLDRGHHASGGTEGRHQAGMDRRAVEPHRAGAAISRIAALLYAEDAAVAQECAQALSGLRLGGKELAVDVVDQTSVIGGARRVEEA